MDAQAQEGEYLEFPLVLSEARQEAVTVSWQLQSSTALEGVDYVSPGVGSTGIPAGSTEASIRIATLSDQVAEPDDRFTLELLDIGPIPPAGAVLSETSRQATGTIKDDDGGLVVRDDDLHDALSRALGAGYSATELANLTSLTTNNVTDLTGPAFAAGLTRLSLHRSHIDDLSPLRHLAALNSLVVESVYVSHPEHGACHDYQETGPPPRADLRDFAHLPLRELWISGYRINDITPLAKMTQLTKLNLNSNLVSDIAPLADLRLADNYINDLKPLAGLTGLRVLRLSENRVTDIAPLAGLTALQHVRFDSNRITRIEPLAGLKDPRWIQLNRNSVVDIAPLVAIKHFAGAIPIWLASNPLSEMSTQVHIPRLRDRGARVFHAEVMPADASAMEGDPLEFSVRLSVPIMEDLQLKWEVDARQWADEHVDFPADQEGILTIPAGATDGVITVQTLQDDVPEDVEPLIVRITQFPRGASSPNVVMATRFIDTIFAVGLIVDPQAQGNAHSMPYVVSGSQALRDSVLRIVNHHRDTATAVRIEAFDDQGGRSEPVTLSIAPGVARNFVAKDLEDGNFAKGLSGNIGSERGDWRLRLHSSDFDALTYVRSAEGLLTGVHDVVPLTAPGYYVATFNPAQNANQVSFLRLSNAGQRPATVSITGVDDLGQSPGSEINIRLPAGQSRSFSSSELESGVGLNGALGDGEGKWRLFVGSDVRLEAMSLMESLTGNLSNLSTLAEPVYIGDSTEETYLAPMFPAAMDDKDRQGFVRVINRGDVTAEVQVVARDDSPWSYEPVTLTVAPGAATHFNSNDLELGNAEKGLPDGVGAGVGNWRLELTSAQDIDVGAFIRTADGFLTSMHDLVRDRGEGFFVPIFNPGSNTRQVSSLRLINLSSRNATVNVRAIDDRGRSPGDEVSLYVGAGSARTVLSRVFEAGLFGLTGAIGQGDGKWRLIVSANQQVAMVNLMESPAGLLTNLSSLPPREPTRPASAR